VPAEFLKVGGVHQLERQSCEYQSRTYVSVPVNQMQKLSAI